MAIICYISFVVSYASHICVLIIDYTWYYLICEIPNKEYGILIKYYGMLRFQHASTPKLLDQF